MDDTLDRHLEDVCNCVFDVAGKANITSILMLGSGSRGELTYSNTDGLKIYGDYEFLIVTRRRPTAKLARELRGGLSRLPKKWGVTNPEFHVDFGLTTEQRLRVQPRTLWTFETKNGGRVLYGRNTLRHLPKVTSENNDLGFLKELILVRLWNLVSHLPDVANGMAAADRTLNYLYARNILDVLTILLPHNGILVCGYAERMSHAAEILIGTEWEPHIPLLKHCTQIKLNKIPLDVARPDLAQRCVELYRKLISQLFQLELTDTASPVVVGADIWRYESKIRRLRRKYLELQHFINFHRCNPVMYKILTSDYIRPRLISILLDMAATGVSRVNGSDPLFCIDEAIEKYENLSGASLGLEQEVWNVDEKWNQLRLALSNYINSWFFRRSPSHKN